MNIDKINVGGNLYDVCDTNARAMISDEYNSATQYSAGDYCIWENTLKKANKSTTGTYDHTAWDDTNIGEVVGELNQNMKNVTSGVPTFGPKFSGAASYIKNGRWCMLTMELTPNSDIENGDIVLSGLPAPYILIYCGITAQDGIYTAVVDTPGELKIYYPAFKSASRIDCTIIYLTGPNT